MSTHYDRVKRWRAGKGPRPLGSKQRSGRRRRLLRRDGPDCFYCALPLGRDCTLEHLVEVSAGGSNDIDNLALAHKRCNARVVGLTVEEKMRVRRARSASG